MSYRGARVGGAVAQSASRFGELLMQLMAQKKQDERYNAESAYRTSRDKIADDNNATMQNIAANRAQAELDMSGYQPGRFVESQNFEPVSASVKAPDMGLGLAKGMGGKGIGQQLMELTAPSGSMRPQTTQTFAPASYDPSRDVSVQRQIALEQAKPKPVEVPYNPATDPVVQRQRYMQANGLARNPNLPAPRHPSEVGAGGPIEGFSKLPADVQKQINTVGPAFQSLDRFKTLTTDYLSQNPVKRGLEQLAPGMGAKVGQIQAAQNAVLLSMKELANLGALAGPDMELVTSLIGDPTNTRALFTNPQSTLNRIEQARLFLEDKVNALEKNYGVKIDRPAGGNMEESIRNYLRGIQ